MVVRCPKLPPDGLLFVDIAIVERLTNEQAADGTLQLAPIKMTPLLDETGSFRRRCHYQTGLVGWNGSGVAV